MQIQPYKSKSAKTENFNFLPTVKRDNFVQNHRTMTKFKLDLLINLMYLYVKFELNVYNCWGDDERKLKISLFFDLMTEQGNTTGTSMRPGKKKYDQINKKSSD
jgi:hypothetical protein